MGGFMETQSNLMQLFMSLGTQGGAANASGEGLLGLGKQQFNSVYDEVLQGLQGDGITETLTQLPITATGLELNHDIQLSGLLVSEAEMEGQSVEQVLPLSGQSLPLADPVDSGPANELNQFQSKSAAILPLAQAIAATSSTSEDGNRQLQKNPGADQVIEQESQAVDYRQQVISSILQAAPLAGAGSTDKLPAGNAEWKGARAELRSGMAQAGKQSTEVIDDTLQGDLDASTEDRFLGAEGVLKSMPTPQGGKVSSEAGLSIPASPQPITAQLTSAEAQVNSIESEPLLEDDLQLSAELDQQRELKADVEKSLQLNKGQLAWGDAISERITMAAAKDIQQATIHLDPPELGAMELKLEVNEERQTQVQVQVQNPQVKEALESSATRLREMLEKEGLQLANLDVSDQSQQQQQGDSDSSSQGGDGFMTNGDEDEVEVTPTIRVSDSLLDTYV
jgi:flagellar hook-length control protein FliK